MKEEDVIARHHRLLLAIHTLVASWHAAFGHLAAHALLFCSQEFFSAYSEPDLKVKRMTLLDEFEQPYEVHTFFAYRTYVCVCVCVCL